MKTAIVFQGGIANVFEIDRHDLTPWLPSFSGASDRHRKRLLQGSYRDAIMFARGLKAAGAMVLVLACNKAGDIAGATWTEDLESQPFAEAIARAYAAFSE
jgi:hypothetical protein